MTQDETANLESLLDGAPLEPPSTEPKGETEPGTPPEDPSADGEQPVEERQSRTVPLPALEDERRKRKEAESDREALRKRLDELEARINGSGQKPAENSQGSRQALPDPYDDPVGYARAIENRNQYAIFETRLHLTRDSMLTSVEDYEEIESVFADAAEKYPRLAYELSRSPNPARYAYETGRKIKLMNEIDSDPAAYEAKLREKILAEAGGEHQYTQKSPSARAPTSLSSVASAPPRPRDDKGRYAPQSLSEILDD